ADLGTLLTWELQTTPALPGTCSQCQSLVAVPIPEGSGGGLDAGVNRPNPFHYSTEIAFRLAQSGHATLRIYDVAGQGGRTLVDGEMNAGPHTVGWDGRDAPGATAPAGGYFYPLPSRPEHREPAQPLLASDRHPPRA